MFEKNKKANRVTFSITVPFKIKQEIEKIKGERSLNYIINNSILLYLKVRKAQKFEDFREILAEIIVNNNDLSLKQKRKIVNDFEIYFSNMRKEFLEYEYLKKEYLKNNPEEADLVEKIEAKGEMYSQILLKKE